MKSTLRYKIHSALERWLPERRLFLRSDTETRFIRLKSGTQLIALVGSTTLVAWTIVATAIVLMDSISSGNFKEQAKREQGLYEARLNLLSAERDKRAVEASAAQGRFSVALTEISKMQTSLLASEERRKELETGIEVIQTTLRTTMKERDLVRKSSADLVATLEQENADAIQEDQVNVMLGTVDFLTAALSQAARQRDDIASLATEAETYIEELTLEAKLSEERNDRIFAQLEEAVSVSLTPLDKMFRAAGLPAERIIAQIRQGYAGQGGPMMPLSFSTRGEAPSPDSLRANAILKSLDEMNLYRIAAQKAPFAMPVKSAFRYTSGYGYRRDPIKGGSRLHAGTDFAASYGTPIYATGDGVVISAGWSSGYGRLVKIQHEFGIETRYAHMAKIRVKVGQRVSRGDQIGDMGNSGRSTGTHLHYEVRVTGKPVNPMTYIKAAQDVF